MGPSELLEVDPATLHLPGSRRDGADLTKLQRQFSRFGKSTAGMPPLQVSRGTDGELVINDGVTRMKSNGTRDELLSALAELGEQHPDWRLGQTIANLAMAAGRTVTSAVWDLEDSAALEAAQRLLDRHRQQIGR